MRLLGGLLAASLSGVNVAAAASSFSPAIASVFFFDPSSPQHRSSDVPTTSVSELELVLAYRLGLSAFHALGTEDATKIQRLSRTGEEESESQLFGSSDASEKAEIVVVVYGVTDQNDFFDDLQPDFVVDPAPGRLEIDSLIDKISSENYSKDKKQTSITGFTYEAMQQFIDWLPSQLGSEFARKVHGYNSKDWAQPYHGILAGELSHLKQLYTWSPSLEENRLYILHIYSLQTLLNYGDLVLHKRTSSLMGKFLKDLETRHTVILLPPSSSYSDEEPDVPRSDELKMRSEIPIAIKKQTSPEPSSIEATKDKDGSDDDKKGGKKVKPRFDGCYGSLADCETSTSKCFGHGKCTRSPLKHENDRSFTCFKCSCSPTVKTANGGNSTINWAGDMCQKKDVSVTFHILLFLTIALIIGVGAGVSLLYSIGGEELPGVLTAPPTSKRT